MVFAGVGFVSLPMSLVRAFVGRPRSTIPRSEYVTRAMALQARAVQIKARCGHRPADYDFVQISILGPCW